MFEAGVESVVASLRVVPGKNCVWRFNALDDASAWLEIEEPCDGFKAAPWSVGSEVWVSANLLARGGKAEVLGHESAGGASQERQLLYLFASNPAFPFEIRTNLTAEFGTGLEQRSATEVFARSDGCSFVWNHGSIGFVTADAAVWVAPGEDKALHTQHGQAFRVKTFAAARAVGSQDARCDSAGSVRFRLLAVGQP